MRYMFVETVNGTVIHTINSEFPIVIGEHFINPKNEREYQVVGIVSKFGIHGKVVMVGPVGANHVNYKDCYERIMSQQ